jgi:hypothetical protein
MKSLFRVAGLSILFTALAACSPPKESIEIIDLPEIFGSTTKSNVPAIYRPFFDAGIHQEDLKTIRSRLPFDSISIRREGCFGTCPVFEMVLHRDGRAELNAKAYLPKLGKFVGEARINTYGRLCYLIETSHFGAMNANFRANWTDASTCIVTVISGTKAKSVSDYGQVGPIELWAIQKLLDATKDQIEWKPKK